MFTFDKLKICAKASERVLHNIWCQQYLWSMVLICVTHGKPAVPDTCSMGGSRMHQQRVIKSEDWYLHGRGKFLSLDRVQHIAAAHPSHMDNPQLGLPANSIKDGDKFCHMSSRHPHKLGSVKSRGVSPQSFQRNMSISQGHLLGRLPLLRSIQRLQCRSARPLDISVPQRDIDP